MAFSSFNTLNQLTNKKPGKPAFTTAPLFRFNFENTIASSGTSANAISSNGTIRYSSLPDTFKQGSFSFDASNGTFNNTQISSINYLEVTFSLSGAMSFCFWVRPKAITANSRYFQIGTANAGIFFLMNANSGAFSVKGNGYGADQAMPTNTWYHWTCVINSGGGVPNIYLNGSRVTLVNPTTITAVSLANQTLRIGAGTDGSDLCLNGYIDDFRIYNIALTASNVTDIYNLVA